MKSTKTLGRPTNWQDFENLCKKLWGEIWQCQEITKNGRTGDKQCGVDIYGIPKGEDSYYGIQCKGKDEYTNQKLTEKEINKEIENAKQFDPPLKKLYFTTTAVKNSDVETIIRKKNIEHRQKGLFEVHLFSWEDIVDLIYENPSTYDYYVNSKSYGSNKAVVVSFNNDSDKISFNLKFLKRTTEYRQRAVLANTWSNPMFDLIQARNEANNATYANMFDHSLKINRSFGRVSFKVKNTGTATIEKFKLYLKFTDGIDDIAFSNIENSNAIAGFNFQTRDLEINKAAMTGIMTPFSSSLVGDDIYESIEIFIKPAPTTNEVKIHWKLLANEFNSSGELALQFNSIVIPTIETILVKDPFDIKVPVEHKVEDYIESVEDNG